MTNFTETAMRHYCRNPRCRMKLPAPVSKMREAFCTKGCRERFYRLRCYVCDEKKPGRLDAHTCGRRKCKNAMRTLKSPSATGRVEIGVGKAIESGVGKPLKPDRAWRIIAGTLTPSQFHCATVPDGIEASNNRLRCGKHFAAQCAFKSNHLPVNILGGYQPKYHPIGLKPGDKAATGA